MNFITGHKENFNSVATVMPVVPSRQGYIENYSDVVNAPLGILEGTVSLQTDL